MVSYLRRRWSGEPTEPAGPLLEDDDSASWWSIRGFTARKYTEIVERVLAKATPAIGEYLFSYLSEDPDPESAVVLNWQETWPDIEADLKAKLRPGVDGLIIADGDRRATFLPHEPCGGRCAGAL